MSVHIDKSKGRRRRTCLDRKRAKTDGALLLDALLYEYERVEYNNIMGLHACGGDITSATDLLYRAHTHIHTHIYICTCVYIHMLASSPFLSFLSTIFCNHFSIAPALSGVLYIFFSP